MRFPRITRTTLILLLFCAIAITTQGCTAALVAGGVAAGAGGVAYARGDLEAISDQPVENCYKASLAALDELDITVISRKQDVLASEIVAYAADDKKITIKIRWKDAGLTKLYIRIGAFGDQARANYIYDRIKEHLIRIAEET